MTKTKLLLAAVLAPLAIATVNVTAADAQSRVDPGYHRPHRQVRPYSPPLGPTMQVIPNRKRCYAKDGIHHGDRSFITCK